MYKCFNLNHFCLYYMYSILLNLYIIDNRSTRIQMPQYKLYYFDARGRAELTRIIFAVAGVAYEDIRFSKDDWPKHKVGAHFYKSIVLTIEYEKLLFLNGV